MTFIPVFIMCLMSDPTACRVMDGGGVSEVSTMRECLHMLEVVAPLVRMMQASAGYPVTLEPACIQRPMGS
jgi:hypothetical protein